MPVAKDEIDAADFAVVQSLIYDYAGIALSDAKRVMVHSRLAKRLRANRFHSYSDYLDFLQGPQGADERIEFINCLTTNKTDFFRENHHFEFLQQQVFPGLGRHGKLRIWSAACSSGEEPYSIAMCVRESFSERADTLILGTDIDTAVLARAKEGSYQADQVSGISGTRLHRFFDRARDGQASIYSAKRTLRDIVKFGRLNFNDARWPISNRFDVIFCRNAMIYFNRETQRRLVERFAALLNPNGYLIIGHSESLHGVTDVFEPLGKTIYRLKSAGPKPPAGWTGSSSPAVANAKVIAKPAAPQIKPRQLALRQPRVEPTATETCDKVFIIVGQSHVSAKPIWVTTVLGSCLAACVYDDVARVGGVCHFTLPSLEYGEYACESYGVHAMEKLINDLMENGAERNRLKAKLFGGVTVTAAIKQVNHIGNRNIQFARKFLSKESIPLLAEKVGGTYAQCLRFHTTTFEAQVKQLCPETSIKAVLAENKCVTRIKPQFGTVTLF